MIDITEEEMKNIVARVHGDSLYLLHKTNISSLFDNYTYLDKDEQYAIFDKITEIAKTGNWSRRKLDIIMDELIKSLKRDGRYSEALWNDMSNYLDAIEGRCASECVIRLNHDPADNVELRGYASSGKWFFDEFYSG